jgi:hypothetical protein
VYSGMNMEIIDSFGLSKDALNKYYLEKDLLRVESAYYATGDESKLGRIDIYKRKLEYLKKAERGDKVKAASVNADNHRVLTQWLGFDSKTLTVYEFYQAMSRLNDESFENQAKNVKKKKIA